VTCIGCGADLPDGARFCPNCGTPVEGALETTERRIVTVLFADIVDSTGLASRLDAERAREVLGAFFDAASDELISLRGEPEKFIGDAVMAVFGLPQVHEDDAIRAIRAGMAIADRTERLGERLDLPEPLQVRVGIEAGDVASGKGPAGQLLVTGPTVNAAARLQIGALPGEVLVGETARALTRMAVAFGEPREILAKGFDEPLTGYPVVSLTTRSVRRTIPLVGRGPELSLLRQLAERVAGIGAPHLVSVIGEPGIGKSRLTQELVAGLPDGTTVLVGRVQSSEWGATFAPVAEMVRDLAGLDDGASSEEARRRLEEVVEGCCPPSETARVAGRIALALELDGDEDRNVSAFVQEVQSGFLALVDGLATRGAVALVFDDVHLAGPPMLDLIERLAAPRRSGPAAVLVVAAGRPELLGLRPTWGSTAANEARIRLEPLGPVESVELARQAGGGRLRERTAERIAARAGGNPFFIVETTGMLLHQEDTLPTPMNAPLPPTVQAVVAARLDHLPPHLRDLARRVAVYLYSFDIDEVRLVAPDATEDDVAHLEDEEIVVREDRPRSRWRFRHQTVRDVAYASLPKRERLRLHLAIAESVERTSGRLAWAAEHLEQAALASLDLDPAERTLPDKAASALAEAGDIYRRRMESATAIEYYQRALALAGPEETWGAREARVLAGMGEARYWRSEYAEALAALFRAEELARAAHDPWALSLALRFHADIVLNMDRDVEDAERLFARALEAAEASGDKGAIARTLLFSGWTDFMKDRFDRSVDTWERALELARGQGDRWAETRALTSISVARGDQDRLDEALELAEQSLAVAHDLGDQFSVGVAAVQVGRILRHEGEAERAFDHFEQAIGIFEEFGARWELADALGERGIALRELGRLDEAEADLQLSVRISEEVGERSLLPWTWRALAKISQRRGDTVAATERFRRADEEETRTRGRAPL
jgi:class 3 adenylate cyclase/tetratricopeptide (TPR) repeat protein